MSAPGARSCSTRDSSFGVLIQKSSLSTNANETHPHLHAHAHTHTDAFEWKVMPSKAHKCAHAYLFTNKQYIVPFTTMASTKSDECKNIHVYTQMHHPRHLTNGQCTVFTTHSPFTSIFPLYSFFFFFPMCYLINKICQTQWFYRALKLEPHRMNFRGSLNHSPLKLGVHAFFSLDVHIHGFHLMSLSPQKKKKRENLDHQVMGTISLV